MKLIGVESAHGFGDTLFTLPLIKALSDLYKKKVGVAVRQHCADGFYNIPWIQEIIIIKSMGDGHKALSQLGYNKIFQITQNIKFPEFCKKYSNHSLIDTPLYTGREIGLKDFDQRPIFIPTKIESETPKEIDTNKPIIAIESIYTSGQSWSDDKAIQMILNKYRGTHKILWLSNSGAPDYVDNMLRYSRRQIIMCLQLCEKFYSVGSGFFCASLALPTHQQPKEIICLWKDDYYKYEKRLSELNWHNNIKWLHNHDELATNLTLPL